MSDSDDSPEGRVGFVTVAIPGPERAGEVRVAIRGGTEHFIAYADQPIARGSEVLIIADRGARAVDVIAG